MFVFRPFCHDLPHISLVHSNTLLNQEFKLIKLTKIKMFIITVEIMLIYHWRSDSNYRQLQWSLNWYKSISASEFRAWCCFKKGHLETLFSARTAFIAGFCHLPHRYSVVKLTLKINSPALWITIQTAL